MQFDSLGHMESISSFLAFGNLGLYSRVSEFLYTVLKFYRIANETHREKF